MAGKRFIVYVDDNFHYGDERERYKLGEFDSCEEAIAACKKVVDECLAEYPKGTSFDELVKGYVMFGEDPFILCEDSSCSFSGREYARKRCKEIAEG